MNDGTGGSEGALDLHDVLVVETTSGEKRNYEVVGVVEDEDQNGYAVGYSEEADEFVVTDAAGKLLEDAELAQEILDDFLAEDGEETK